MSQKKSAHRVRRIFGDNVRTLRVNQGRSQEALAEAAHLSQQYLSEVEHGKRSIGIDAVGQLADALGVSLAQLFIEGAINPPNIRHR